MAENCVCSSNSCINSGLRFAHSPIWWIYLPTEQHCAVFHHHASLFTFHFFYSCALKHLHRASRDPSSTAQPFSCLFSLLPYLRHHRRKYCFHHRLFVCLLLTDETSYTEWLSKICTSLTVILFILLLYLVAVWQLIIKIWWGWRG